MKTYEQVKAVRDALDEKRKTLRGAQKKAVMGSIMIYDWVLSDADDETFIKENKKWWSG